MKFSILSKSFATKQVLGPIQLDLEERSISALMGPSGSGKTTLLRIIAELECDDCRTPQPDIKIGFVFQDPCLLPWKTVAENIAIAGPEHELLNTLGLHEMSKLYPRQLSLGMARRVAIARALAYKPDLLILDEPFASLDIHWVETLRHMIISASRELKNTILFTTHHIHDAHALGARILKLEGSPATLREIGNNPI